MTTGYGTDMSALRGIAYDWTLPLAERGRRHCVISKWSVPFNGGLRCGA